MNLKSFLSLLLLNVVLCTSSSAQDLLDIFYVKPYYATHWNAIERSNINTTSFGVRSGRDRTMLARGRNFGMGIGAKLPDLPVYIEGGYGFYNLAQKNDFNSVSFSSGYPTVKNTIHCYQFYGSIGYEVPIGKKLFLSPHIGIRYIEIFRFANLQTDSGIVHNTDPYIDSVRFHIYVSHFSFGVLLINLGTQVEYRVRHNLGILFDCGLETGFKSMLTTGTSYKRYNAVPFEWESNMTYNKGESLQASIGLNGIRLKEVEAFSDKVWQVF